MAVSIFEGCTDACGWTAAVIAVLSWGSFGVPIKLAPGHVQVNFLVMQTYKTTVTFLTCWLVLLLGEEVQFSYWGIASGLFWVPGAACGIYAIRQAGLAVAVGTWSSIQVLTSFVFGILIFHEGVKSLTRTCFAFITLTCGLIGMSRYAGMGSKSSSSSSKQSPPSTLSSTAASALAAASNSGGVVIVGDHSTNSTATTSSSSTSPPSSVNNVGVPLSAQTLLGSSDKASLSDSSNGVSGIAGSERSERVGGLRKNVKDSKNKANIVVSDDSPAPTTSEKRKVVKKSLSSSAKGLFVVGIDDVKKLTPISAASKVIKSAVAPPAPPAFPARSGSFLVPMEMEPSSAAAMSNNDAADDEAFVMMSSSANSFSSSTNPQHQRLLEDYDYPTSDYSGDDADDKSPRRKRVAAGELVVLCGGRVVLTRRQLGMLGAVINGGWGGCNLIPMHYALRDDGLTGAAYLISYSCGAMIVNVAIWILLFLYYWHQRQGNVQEALEALPKFHFEHLWFPGLMAGLLYSLGNFCSILAVTYLGQGTGFSFCQMQLFISGLWGVFYFYEIQGAECVMKWFMSAAVAVTGIIWLSYEHEEGGAIGHR